MANVSFAGQISTTVSSSAERGRDLTEVSRLDSRCCSSANDQLVPAATDACVKVAVWKSILDFMCQQTPSSMCAQCQIDGSTTCDPLEQANDDHRFETGDVCGEGAV